MKKFTWKEILATSFGILICSSIFTYAAIQSQVGMNILKSANLWVPVKGVTTTGTSIPDASSGLLANGTYVYEGQGAEWWPVSGGFTIGSFTNATRKGMYTVSNIIGTAANGSGSVQAASVSPPGTFGLSTGLGSALLVASISECVSGTLNVQCTPGRTSTIHLTDTTSVSDDIVRITTNTDTLIGNAGDAITGLIVNVAGTGSTVAIYNDNTTPCNVNYLFTLPTTTVGITTSINLLNGASMPGGLLGFCALTAGAGAADITFLHANF